MSNLESNDKFMAICWLSNIWYSSLTYRNKVISIHYYFVFENIFNTLFTSHILAGYIYPNQHPNILQTSEISIREEMSEG